MTDLSAGASSKGSDQTSQAEALPAGSENSTSFAVLERLATALGVPVAAFLTDAAGSNLPPAIPEDTSSLVDAFSRISCPIARRRCLDLVRAAAAEEAP